MARFKKRHIAIIIVAVVALTFTISFLRRSGTVDAGLEETPKGTPVEIRAAQRGDINSVAVISGKLEALYRVNVIAKATGNVKNIVSRVGQPIAKGDTIFVIDDSDIKLQLDQAKAGLSMAEANFEQNRERFESARKDLARGELLYEQGAISEQALEQMRTAASDAGLNVLEAQLNQARASYELAHKQYKECNVTSPIEGIVAYINVNVGETVSPGAPVAVVVDMSSVVLEGTIGEGLINHVEREGDVKVRIPSARDIPFSGIIKEISPAAEQRTGLFGLKVSIDNPDDLIKPGMFAEADLIKDSKEAIIYVPTAAVTSKNDIKHVFIVEEGTAYKREVITGISGDGIIEIINGVNEDEEVVIKGQSYLNDGDTVHIVRSDDK